MTGGGIDFTGGVIDFTGKVVVVTGGARGVGRGITEAFLAAGAEVTICGRNEPGRDELPAAAGDAPCSSPPTCATPSRPPRC